MTIITHDIAAAVPSFMVKAKACLARLLNAYVEARMRRARREIALYHERRNWPFELDDAPNVARAFRAAETRHRSNRRTQKAK